MSSLPFSVFWNGTDRVHLAWDRRAAARGGRTFDAAHLFLRPGDDGGGDDLPARHLGSVRTGLDDRGIASLRLPRPGPATLDMVLTRAGGVEETGTVVLASSLAPGAGPVRTVVLRLAEGTADFQLDDGLAGTDPRPAACDVAISARSASLPEGRITVVAPWEAVAGGGRRILVHPMASRGDDGPWPDRTSAIRATRRRRRLDVVLEFEDPEAGEDRSGLPEIMLFRAVSEAEAEAEAAVGGGASGGASRYATIISVSDSAASATWRAPGALRLPLPWLEAGVPFGVAVREPDRLSFDGEAADGHYHGAVLVLAAVGGIPTLLGPDEIPDDFVPVVGDALTKLQRDRVLPSASLVANRLLAALSDGAAGPVGLVEHPLPGPLPPGLVAALDGWPAASRTILIEAISAGGAADVTGAALEVDAEAVGDGVADYLRRCAEVAARATPERIDTAVARWRRIAGTAADPADRARAAAAVADLAAFAERHRIGRWLDRDGCRVVFAHLSGADEAGRRARVPFAAIAAALGAAAPADAPDTAAARMELAGFETLEAIRTRVRTRAAALAELDPAAAGPVGRGIDDLDAEDRGNWIHLDGELARLLARREGPVAVTRFLDVAERWAGAEGVAARFQVGTSGPARRFAAVAAVVKRFPRTAPPIASPVESDAWFSELDRATERLRAVAAAALPSDAATAADGLSIDQVAAYFRILALHRFARRADTVIDAVVARLAGPSVPGDHRARLERTGAALGWLRSALPEGAGILAARLNQAEELLGCHGADGDWSGLDAVFSAIATTSGSPP